MRCGGVYQCTCMCTHAHTRAARALHMRRAHASWQGAAVRFVASRAPLARFGLVDDEGTGAPPETARKDLGSRL